MGAMELFSVAAMLVGAAVVGFVFGIPNLLQAAKLSRPLRLKELPDHVNELVVVYGEPDPVDEIELKRRRCRILWMKTEHREREGAGRNAHYRTTKKKERKTDFWINFPDGGRVFVYCEPTEVQGGGTYRGGQPRGSMQSYQHWFPVPKRMTVMGKLILEDQGAAIVQHGKMGQFFSASSPRQAAKQEWTKGVAATAAAVIGLFLGLVVAIAALTR